MDEPGVERGATLVNASAKDGAEETYLNPAEAWNLHWSINSQNHAWNSTLWSDREFKERVRKWLRAKQREQAISGSRNFQGGRVNFQSRGVQATVKPPTMN